MSDTEGELIPPDDPRFEGAVFLNVDALKCHVVENSGYLRGAHWRWTRWHEREAVEFDPKTGEERDCFELYREQCGSDFRRQASYPVVSMVQGSRLTRFGGRGHPDSARGGPDACQTPDMSKTDLTRVRHPTGPKQT